MVIAHSSASINIAVLLKKPIILYKSIPHKYSIYHTKLLEAFQRELDLEVFEYKSMQNFSFEKINFDEKRYQKYIDNFLLPKGVNTPSYKILNEFLNRKTFKS